LIFLLGLSVLGSLNAHAEDAKREVVFKAGSVTLAGPELKPGDAAPDFKLAANNLSEVTLADSKGKYRVITTLVSLDTQICDIQAKRFDEEAAKLSKDVAVYVVSMDLPFAQKRWCGTSSAANIKTLSDYRDASFGTSYGVLMKENRLLSRSVFVIDPENKIVYAEYVKDTARQPNYESALKALKAVHP
jgi:thiol peroxidase